MKILNYKIIKNEQPKKSKINETIGNTRVRLRSESMSELNLNVKSSLIVIKKIKFHKPNLSFQPIIAISFMNNTVCNEISFNLLSFNKNKNFAGETPRKFNSSSFPKNIFHKKEMESPMQFNKSSSIVFTKNLNNNQFDSKGNFKSSSVILLSKKNIQQLTILRSPGKDKENKKKKYSVLIS